AGLVEHPIAIGDVETQVQVSEAPALAELELLEDRVGADAVARVVRIEAAIHRGDRACAAVGNGDADQLTPQAVAKLEAVAARAHQKVAIAFLIDRGLTVIEAAPLLV